MRQLCCKCDIGDRVLVQSTANVSQIASSFAVVSNTNSKASIWCMMIHENECISAKAKDFKGKTGLLAFLRL